MTMVEITVELPKELVERARAVGIDVESFLSEFLAEWLTTEIKKREAAVNLTGGREDTEEG